MDNKAFNDILIQWAAECVVSQGYAHSLESAKTWLENLQEAPEFAPSNQNYSERGAVKTLTRLCDHAYEIISYRRSGMEVELPRRVKAYYAPRFENLERGKSFYAPHFEK